MAGQARVSTSQPELIRLRTQAQTDPNFLTISMYITQKFDEDTINNIALNGTSRFATRACPSSLFADSAASPSLIQQTSTTSLTLSLNFVRVPILVVRVSPRSLLR